jgi:hypothetical protein
LLGWHGTTVEPALADIAAQPEKHVGDGLVFDSFGNGSEAETVAQADDGGCNLSALARVGHGANKAGVDFELVEGEELKVAETGVAGAEVVQRQAGAILLQLGGDAGGVFGIADESAFGDFENKTVERKVCVQGGRADVFWKREVSELGEGDVNGQSEMARDIFRGGEDCAEELAGEESVKAGLFGERDELTGGDKAAVGMLPSGESFEAAQEASAKFNERLKVGHYLVAFECSAEIVGFVASHGWNDTTVQLGLTL